MLKSGQDRAKRCTKYLTNLETISCHFSLKPANSGSIIDTADKRDMVAYLARASHEPFDSLGIHLYRKNALRCSTSETSSAQVYKNKSLDKCSLFNNPITYKLSPSTQNRYPSIVATIRAANVGPRTSVRCASEAFVGTEKVAMYVGESR